MTKSGSAASTTCGDGAAGPVGPVDGSRACARDGVCAVGIHTTTMGMG